MILKKIAEDKKHKDYPSCKVKSIICKVNLSFIAGDWTSVILFVALLVCH